jgi:hypothetical protein
MANRNSTNVEVEIDKLNEADAASVLAYISRLLSSRKPQSRETTLNDPLILSLSDAYENQRARQVTEWERLYRQNVQRAA